MKKFLSVILALAMVVSMLAITTFAASDSLDYDMTNIDTSKSAGTYAADGNFTSGSHDHGLYMPCFKLGYDNWACLGTLDLSKYDHAVIFYCTDGGYKALKDTMNGAVGLKSEGSSYGWADQTSYNLSGDLGHANTVDAYVTDAEAGGWASNIRAAFIDLTDVTYNGEVYVSSFSSTGNEIVITDILFLAEIDYDMTTYDAGKSAGAYAADGDFTSGSHAHGLYMPCFKLGYDNWLCLGNMDLSNIYGAYIYYCTDGSYKALKDTMNGAVGFKSEASSYGWADQTSYNLSGDLGHANTVDAYVTDAEAGGWASNIRAAFIDLSNVDYSGDLYATSFSSTGNELVITDIVFIGMTEDAAPATLVGVSRDTVGYTAGGVETTLKDGEAPEYLASNPLVCDQGAWKSVFLRGWVGYDITIDTFGYKIDGGEFVAGSFTQPTEDAVKTPANGGANASRYKVFIPVAALAAGEHTVTASVKLSSGEICDLWTAPLTVNAVISDPIYDATFVYNFARGIGVYKQGTPSNLEFTDEDGYVAFKATGDDPYTVLSSPEGAAADLTWVKIKYRTTASSNKGEFYYGRSDGVGWASPIEKSHVDWNWNKDGEWNTIVFNATAFTEGAADGVTLTNFRFDPLQTAVTEGMSIDVAYIAFFKNEASADAYTGPAASTVENDYNLMADGSIFGVGYWMHPAAVGRYIEFTFTTPTCFKGFSTYIYATGKASGGCKAKLELYCKGILLETIDLDCQGDSVQAADFSRTYPEGKYAIRIVGNDKDQEGVYIVLAWADKDDAKDTVVTVACDSNDASKVPYFTLIGAEHTDEPALADAKTVGKYVDATKAVKGETETDYTSGTAFEKRTYDAVKLVGWYGANYAVESFGYRIGDGEAVYGEWAEDVDATDPVRASTNGGDLAKRFEIPADISALAAGKYTVTYVAKLADGSVMDISAVDIEITETPVTPPTPPTGSAAAIIVAVAVMAIGAGIVVSKKRIAD